MLLFLKQKDMCEFNISTYNIGKPCYIGSDYVNIIWSYNILNIMVHICWQKRQNYQVHAQKTFYLTTIYIRYPGHTEIYNICFTIIRLLLYEIYVFIYVVK